jgi:mannose-6-phosphate isomerase-like protein (cupin superfamily)
MLRRCLVVTMVVGISMGLGRFTAARAHAQNSAVSNVTVRTLAHGVLKTLPASKVFVGVLDFRQVPGAGCGPTCRLPGVVYTLHGVASISSPGAPATSVSPGEAAFTSALAVHTNDNIGGRVGAGTIATGLIVLVILLGAATRLGGGLRRAIILVLSLFLVAGGALVLAGATSNEWYFFSVRPDSQLSQPMLRPDGRVAFASRDLDPVPVGPSTETLNAITISPGGRYDAPDVNGPETLIVVEGTATFHIGDETGQVRSGHGSLAQAGKTLAIVNPGSDTLQVLDFAVIPLSAASPAG